MADLGAQPTKKSVRITSTTGDFCTIAAATGSTAGVMSADDKRRLDEIWGKLDAMGSDGGLIAIAPPDMGDYVRRGELQQALQAAARTAVALRPVTPAPPAQITADVSPRIAALEATVSALDGAPRRSPGASGIDARLAALEEAVMQLVNEFAQHQQRIAAAEQGIALVNETLGNLYNIVAEDDHGI